MNATTGRANRAPRPPKPTPPLTRSQITALRDLVARTEPTTMGTLDSSPLSYWRLIRCVRPVGFPLWVATERGRQWLAAHDAYAASAPARRPRKVDPS